MLSWQSYKENVLEPMLNGTEKVPAMITDFKEYHTDTTVRFVVKMSEEKLQEAEHAGLHKVFKLQTPLTCNSMVMSATPCLHRNVSCTRRACWSLHAHYKYISILPFLGSGCVWPRGQSEEVRLGAGYPQGLLWAEDEILPPKEGLADWHAGGGEFQTQQPGPLHPGKNPGHLGYW